MKRFVFWLIIVMISIALCSCNTDTESPKNEELLNQQLVEIHKLEAELESNRKQISDLQEQVDMLKSGPAFFRYNNSDAILLSIIYNGTGYVELKGILNLLNKKLSYNSETKIIYVNDISDSTSQNQNGVNGDAKKPVIVYITKTGKKYHRLGCRYLKNGQEAISLLSAKLRGYTPCGVCGPPN